MENKIVSGKNKTQDLGVGEMANTRYIMFEIAKNFVPFLFNMHKTTAFAIFYQGIYAICRKRVLKPFLLEKMDQK